MVLDDLAAYLATQGCGTLATDLFVSQLPATPDLCTALFEYEGQASLRAMAAGPGAALAERPNVQVVVRGGTYAAARSRIEAAYMHLDGLSFTSSSGVRYMDCAALQPPFFLDRDETGRSRLAFNIAVVKALG